MRVHRMRGPAEEHHRLLCAVGALDLRQHALLARLSTSLKPAEPELVGLDQVEDELVAVVAGLDAVDRCRPAAFRNRRDVGEILEARIAQVGGHRQRVLRAHQVAPTTLDRAVLAERAMSASIVGIQLPRNTSMSPLFMDGERHRHRQHGYDGLVAELRQDLAEHGRRRGFCGPAHVRKAHGAAGRRIDRGCGSTGGCPHAGKQRQRHLPERAEHWEQGARPRAPAQTHCLPLRKNLLTYW